MKDSIFGSATPRWARRAAVMAVAALGLLATPTIASAQGKPAPANCIDKDLAKKEFVKGRLAYRRGDYEEAIIKWQNSYARCQKPLTLFNIGNAYERLGELKEALKHFEQYRPSAPKHEHADLDNRMEGLRQRIAEQEKNEQAQQAEVEAAKKAEEERKRREAWEAERRRRMGNKGPWPIIGWTAVGVGAAAVIAGVVMDAVAAGKRPEESEACLDNAGRLLCRDSQRDDIESSNTLAIAGDATWIAGAVVAAAGGTILILSATGVLRVRAGGDAAANGKRNDDALLHDIELSPFGAGLMMHARF